MKLSREDKIFDIINYIVLGLISLLVLYPLYFMVIASFSSPEAINSGQIVLLPRGVTLDGYKRLMQDSNIWIGYRNTIIYTICATILNIIVTVSAAFALAHRDLVGKQFFMGYFVFTMYFSGGMIPLYIVVNKIGLYNNPLVLIILGAVSVYNLIIARTFFQSTLPQELYDAAAIDGCGTFRFFIQIAVPLSKAIIAVLVVFYGVAHWNEFFNALMYISNKEYYPLQLVLREILLQSRMVEQVATEAALIDLQERQRYAELIKYGVIVVSSLPILAVYPFAQKYFVKGVMIGSVKG